MAQHAKNIESIGQVDRETLYGVSEAIDIVKRLSRPSFDETVELAVRLGVDPQSGSDRAGTLSLPPDGRTERVAVFAAGEQAAEARAAGADVVALMTSWPRSAGDFSTSTWRSHPDLMARWGRSGGSSSSWAHAEPKTARHDGRGQGRDGVQGRPGGVPHRQGRQRAHPYRKASFTREQLVTNLHA